MKAIEIIKKHYEKMFGTMKYEDSILYNTFESVITGAIKEYAKDACKKQRHLCCKNWRENKNENPKLQPMSIFDAPTPEMR